MDTPQFRTDFEAQYGKAVEAAPEVDGLVVIPGALPVGKMTRARITGAMEYDLMGERDT